MKNAHTDIVTIIKAHGKRLTKLHRPGASEGYGSAYKVSSVEREVSSIFDLHELLTKLEDATSCCVIRGRRRDASLGEREVRRAYHLDPDKDPPGFEPSPRRWLCVDIDNVTTPDDIDPEADPEGAVLYCLSLLPDWLQDVTCHWQWSSSAGLKGWEFLKLHLWFWLDAPVDDPSHRAWALRSGVADPMLYNPVQPHYTASPLFEGLEDPVERRSGLLEGSLDIALVPNAIARWTEREEARRQRARAERAARRVEYTVSSARQRAWIDAQVNGIKADLEASAGAQRHPVAVKAAGSLANSVQIGWISESEARAVLDCSPIADLPRRDGELDRLWQWAMARAAANPPPEPDLGPDKPPRPRPIYYDASGEPRRPEPPPIAEDPTMPPDQGAPRGGTGGGSSSEGSRSSSPPPPSSPDDDDDEPALDEDDEPALLDFDSHVYLAQTMAEELAPAGRLIACGGALWRYKDGCWSRLGERALRSHVHKLDRRLVLAGRDRRGKNYYRPLKASSTLISGVCREMVALEELLDDTFFEEPTQGLLFRNGLLQVTRGGWELLPPSPSHRARWRLDMDWDPDAPCPRWEQALWQWFEPLEGADEVPFDPMRDAEGKAAFLQQFAGAALCGLATRFARCALLFGPKAANGKSRIIKALQRLFPPGARAQVTPQQMAASNAEYYLARLAGVRLNASTELPAKEVASSEAFKALVTGDTVEARAPGGEPFTLTPEAAHLFSANKLPPTRDQTQGWWRRFVLVKFEHSFPEGDPRRDPHLDDALAREAPGIARWAVEGAIRLLKAGEYTIPASHAHEMERWRRRADSTALWCTERLERVDDPSMGIKMSAGWEDYKEWAKEGNFMLVNRRTFYERTKDILGAPHKRTAGLLWPYVFRQREAP